MSVFTFDAAQGNPVTTETVDKLCSELGVRLKDEEKEKYRTLLAVFHDASEALMEMEGELAQIIFVQVCRTDEDYKTIFLQ